MTSFFRKVWVQLAGPAGAPSLGRVLNASQWRSMRLETGLFLAFSPAAAFAQNGFAAYAEDTLQAMGWAIVVGGWVMFIGGCIVLGIKQIRGTE